MKRFVKYIAGAAILLVVLAALACTSEDAATTDPSSSTGPTAAATGATQMVEATATGASGGTEPAMTATQPAEATAMPGGDGGEATSATNQGDSRLAVVLNRGTVICASNNSLAGFGFIDDNGNTVGFDIDLCRAVAAAVLGDANAVEFRPTTAAERGPTMQSGEVDMMSRNTTWTTSRNATWGNFAPTMFYDGQGFMIPKSVGVSSAMELGGASVCVQQGTTTELNLQDFIDQNSLDIEVVVFENNEGTRAAYLAGQCDALTTDRSGLVATRAGFDNPDAHTILPETISEEPLGPVVPHGDEQWFDLVTAVMTILIYGEAYGITSDNIPSGPTGDTAIDRMLGFDGSYGQAEMGLSPTVAQDVLRAVGNYGEIYDRHLTPLDLTREGSRNALWSSAPCTDCPRGGQVYAAPLR